MGNIVDEVGDTEGMALVFWVAGTPLYLYSSRGGIDTVPPELVEDVAAVLRATLERVTTLAPTEARDILAHEPRDAGGRVSLTALRRLLLHPKLTAKEKVAAAAAAGYPVERVSYEPEVHGGVGYETATYSRWTASIIWDGEPTPAQMTGIADFGHPDRGGPEGVENIWQTLELGLLSSLAGV